MLSRLLVPKLNLREAYKALETEAGIPALIAALAALCDPETAKRLHQTLKATTWLCVNPFCTKGPDGGRTPVDLTRKSGACCRECMSYECTHPSCQRRAANAGWKHATHAWGSKIAATHVAYRKMLEVTCLCTRQATGAHDPTCALYRKDSP